MPGGSEPAFEVERFAWAAPDRLEVTGHWSGVRGRRFVRPTLDVHGAGKQRRLLAVLDDKPWAPEDGRPWRAAFPWEGGEVDLTGAELAVAPDLAVVLGAPGEHAPPATRAVRTPAPEPAPRTERRPDPAIDRLREELDAVRDQRDRALRDLERLRDERDAAVRELRDAAPAPPARDDAATEERDAALRERDDAVLERNAAAAERDAAVGEREDARREAARLRAERDAAVDERDVAHREHVAAMAAARPADLPPAAPRTTHVEVLLARVLAFGAVAGTLVLVALLLRAIV